MKKIVDDQYEIREKLGSGGFANVYRGWDLLHDREVAIKIILSNLAEDEKLVRMFLDEGHMAGRLKHHNIVQLFDIGHTKDGVYYSVMEFIDGYDLFKVVQANKRNGQKLPFELSAYIISQICEGLYFAHTKKDKRTGELLKIVHRDVTPSNILISKQAEIKLTDFGIAKANLGRREKTRVGELKGKLTYMSPEQGLGGETKIDHRSDIFSLGIVFYEMLTGLYAYEGETELEIHRKVIKAEIDHDLLEKSDAPQHLKQIVFKSLEKNPNSRYTSAREMADDLNAFLSTKSSKDWQKELKEYLIDLFVTPGHKTRTAEPVQAPNNDQEDAAVSKEKEAEIQPTAVFEDHTVQPQATGSRDKTIKLNPTQVKKTPRQESDADRTRIDIIIDSFRYHKKIVTGVAIGLAVLILVFFTLDSLMKWTSVGERIHYWIVQPNVRIESVPSGAQVYLHDGEYIGRTPIPVKLDPLKTHKFRLQYAGFNPIEGVIGRLAGLDTTYIEKRYFKSSITFLSSPDDVAILLNNSEIGRTPLTMPLEVGKKFNLQYQVEGFEPLECTFNLNEDPINWAKNKFYWKETKFGADSVTLTGTLYKNVKIEVRPAEASLKIDSRPEQVVDSEIILPLAYGEHDVYISKRNWIPHNDKINIDMATTEHKFNLWRDVKFIVQDADNPSKRLDEAEIYIGKTTRSASKTFRLGPYRYNAQISHEKYATKDVTVPVEEFEIKVLMELRDPILSLHISEASSGAPLSDVFVYVRTNMENVLEILGATDLNGNFEKPIPVDKDGNIELKLQKSGYMEWSDTIYVRRGETVTKVIEMEKR